MGCIVEFSEPLVRFDFCENKNMQRTLIDVLIKYSKLNLENLANLIEVPLQTLIDVHQGMGFLTGDVSENLCKYFLLFFSG